MNNVVIRVENLGKTFRIGAQQVRYQTLRDSLTRAVTSSFHRAAAVLRGHASETGTDEIWALQDVSLEVQRGEVIGIIGCNGAGKSTLLKILSRITDPTQGRVSIKGRVGSLLEVGTGFHPELTGRENIYLNGAILGMRKTEINKKFEEIVEFAELERFLETPVKHYSSGMYTRLAFAVAAHLETEILLVDEVLAVGDASFQRKCLGKMSAVAKEGRTVVFVSHNTAAILSLCGRATWLNAGKVCDDGETSTVVQRYLKSMSVTEGMPLQQRTDRKGDGSARLISLRIEGTDHDQVIRPGSRWKVILGYHSEQPLQRADFCLSVYDYMLGCRIFELDSEVTGGMTETLPAEGTVTCLTDPVDLSPGRCYVNATLMRNGVLADYIPHALSFDVEVADVYGTGKTPARNHVINVIKHHWFAGNGAH
jgi:lipopolysaccharide transport system ATP-binding protein